MEAKELYKSSSREPIAEKDNSNYLGHLLLVLSLTSCLFLVSRIIESTMNYDSTRANILSYFTIQSNIILTFWMISMTVYTFTKSKTFSYAMNVNLSAAITTYMLVTGLIYWIVLVPVFYLPGETWLFTKSNIWMHTLTPITAVIMLKYVKACQTNTSIKPRFGIFYVYPIFYIMLALTYALNGAYLYPMFNPDLLGGWIGVGVCIVVMCIIFTGLYLTLLYGFKKNNKQRLTKQGRNL